MSAGWYETSGPTKGWKPSGVGLEDASKSARARAAAERVFVGMAVHGTHSRYGNGCRCDECREGERVYRNQRYQLVKEQEREKVRQKYASDPEFRAKRIAWNRDSRRRKAAERRGGQ